MIAKCKNGDEVELGIGDTYPPGHVGQHTNVGRVWVRATGGKWVMSSAYSMHRTMLLVESCESAPELLDMLEAFN